MRSTPTIAVVCYILSAVAVLCVVAHGIVVWRKWLQRRQAQLAPELIGSKFVASACKWWRELQALSACLRGVRLVYQTGEKRAKRAPHTHHRPSNLQCLPAEHILLTITSDSSWTRISCCWTDLLHSSTIATSWCPASTLGNLRESIGQDSGVMMLLFAMARVRRC